MKGGGPAQQDVIGGRVLMLAAGFSWVAPMIKSGRIKVLAILSQERDAAHSEYPVIAETLPGVSALSMVGIVVPAGVPRELIAKIRYDIAQAVRSSDLTGRLRAQGMEPVGSTPQEFHRVARAQIQKC